MTYDFDEVINRKNTDSLKYDFAARRKKPENALPLWVADMDFQTPACVIQALVNKSQHGIFGYSDSRDDYFEILKSWFERRFNWHIQPDWLVKTPGVVNAICTAIRALTNEHDAIIIQQPVYYPFAESIKANHRRLIINNLSFKNGKYQMDFDDFERKIKADHVKLFILCNPHNPVGRVWTRDELITIGDICLKHGVKVISDEIHADFILTGHQHIVFSDLKSDFSSITITCTSPTKTFNLAGLQISNIFISNPILRKHFHKEMVRSGYSQTNIMGLIACKAAYSHEGDVWLKALKKYLNNNLDYLRDALKDTPINLVEPEGTYLVWIDCSKLSLSDRELDDFMLNKAQLWLDAGTMFGDSGSGFQRINIACPQKTLKQAILQLKDAINNLEVNN